MAQLSKILGAILRDMVSAQHEANMYAIKLSSAYSLGNQPTAMRPPAVCFGEVELMLHCGFTDKSADEVNNEIDYAVLFRNLNDLSSRLTNVIVSSIISTILQNKESINNSEGPIARLEKEKVLRRNFITFLSHKLLNYLKGHRSEFISPDGTVDQKILLEDAMYISETEFLSHDELDSVFVNDSSGELLKKVKENLRTDIKFILPRLLKEMSFVRQSKYESLDVVVSASELAKLPLDCIQSLRMRISPRDLPAEADSE